MTTLFSPSAIGVLTWWWYRSKTLSFTARAHYCVSARTTLSRAHQNYAIMHVKSLRCFGFRLLVRAPLDLWLTVSNSIAITIIGAETKVRWLINCLNGYCPSNTFDCSAYDMRAAVTTYICISPINIAVQHIRSSRAGELTTYHWHGTSTPSSNLDMVVRTSSLFTFFFCITSRTASHRRHARRQSG